MTNDSYVNSAAATVTLTVTPINDEPSGADATVTTSIDTAYTFSNTDFGFSDPNDSPANGLQAIKITTLPGAGTLTNNGAISLGQSISSADIAANQFVFTPAADDSGEPYSSFTFQVQDDGGTANGGVNLAGTPSTITVMVTIPDPINDRPWDGAWTNIIPVNNMAQSFTVKDPKLTSVSVGLLTGNPGINIQQALNKPD